MMDLMIEKERTLLPPLSLLFFLKIAVYKA